MTRRFCYFNDGSPDAPKLLVYLNLGSLEDLGSESIWPGLDGSARCQRLLDDGFEGVQLTSDDLPVSESTVPFCGLDRINTADDADMIAAKHAARGDQCLTIHAGWGMENDDEVFRLTEAILNASERHRLPIFIETHRATMTQDLWRTVQLTKTFPEIRFNGDFSHYYCGQELVYGDWERKLLFMEPIFARIGFLHGRVASPGCMQVPIDTDLTARPAQAHGAINYLDHFKELWTRAMCGFLGAADRGSVLIFAPELLSPAIYYARMFPHASGRLVEESDRYRQAILLKDLAHACFSEAQRIFGRLANSGHVVSP
ncbi:MAG: hypothetical protein WB341_02715 [Terracidiphilus sp.]